MRGGAPWPVLLSSSACRSRDISPHFLLPSSVHCHSLLDPRQGTYPQDKEPHQASWDHHIGPLRIGDKGRTLGGTTMNGWSKQWTDKGVYPIRWIKETEGDK